MTAQNPFVLSKEEYKRDINFVKHYKEDVAFFLSKMTGDSIEETRKFVNESLAKGGIFELKDPRIVYLERENYSDRFEKEGTLLEYIYGSIAANELIAPTFTTYVPPSERQSILVEFVDDNVAIRSKAKKAMFAAKMANDTNMYNFKNSEQSNAKISNNSISGGHVSASTPLNNKTAHSTLTSNCRCTSGYGNANNEKMLSGNRHYHHPNIVINNIVSIANRTNMYKLEMAMKKFGMHYPTPQEALETVLISSRLYWRSKQKEDFILELLTKLEPIERAAFVYVGDLFHIARYNDSLVRTFIDRLSWPGSNENLENPLDIIHSNREEFISLATQLVPDVMKGIDWKKLKQDNSEDAKKLSILAETILNIRDTIEDYRDFIEAFFVTDNVPASLAFFPTSIRRAALTSDTDSTIFTVQDWVLWKTGRMVVDTETNRVAATMIFLAAEAITHILARMSANFGIETKRIHQVAMKNEFKFDVFVPTQVGKHYFANISCQEGNLYIDYEMEIKGVHLKSSNVPASIMKKAEAMMKSIMDAAAAGETISVKEKIEEVAQIEKQILQDAIAGNSNYYRSLQIKSANSYSGELSQSNYSHHFFWDEVFSAKYGVVPEPPYMTYKVPVRLPNPKAIEAWLASIKDLDMQNRARDWIKRNNKNAINTMYLPQQRIQATGIPKEIIPILDMRRTLLDCTTVFYLILETLGYYCLDKKIRSVAADYYADFSDDPDLVSAFELTQA